MTTPSRSRALTPLLAVVVAVLTAFGLSIGSPALAHDELVSSNPEDGAQLDKQPDWIELEFSGTIQNVGTEIAVMHEGENVSAGEITVEGTKVMSALPEGLAPGEYTVEWRVVSEDGHPISDSLTFTIGDSGGAGEESAAAEGEGEDGKPGLGAVAVDEPEQGAQDQEHLAETGESGGMSTPMVVLLAVGGLALAALVVVLLMRKSKGVGPQA